MLQEVLARVLARPLQPDHKGTRNKNQAYTYGNPINYFDDDLFGYMIAGATEAEDDTADTGQGIEDMRRVFEAENLKDAEALKTRLLDGSDLSKFILSKVPTAEENLRDSATSPEDTSEILLNVLDEAARDPRLAEVAGSKSSRKKPKPEEIPGINTKILLRTFSKELQEKPKRATKGELPRSGCMPWLPLAASRPPRIFKPFPATLHIPAKTPSMNPTYQGSTPRG